MRFDNFPLELKRLIMSYLPPYALSEKVSAVSKEWELLARDTLNWKVVEFFSHDDSIHTIFYINHILQGTRVEKITFNYYSFKDCDDLTALPVLNSVKEVVLHYCTYLNNEALQIFGLRFPNVRKLSIDMDPDGVSHDEEEEYFYDLVKVEHLQQWKNLKSVQLGSLYKYYNADVVTRLVKQDLQLEELILEWSGVTNDSTLKTIVKYQGRYLRKFVMQFDSITTSVYQELISCRCLESLSLYDPTKLTDSEFVRIIGELKHLKYFRIEYALKIFSNQFRKIFKDVILNNLLELVIVNCPNLNDNDFTLIVKNSPLLKRLKLDRFEKITDKGLESLPTVGSNLKILHLTCLKLVTKPCVIKISRELPNLCEVVVKWCPQISEGYKFCIINDTFLNKNKK